MLDGTRNLKPFLYLFLDYQLIFKECNWYLKKDVNTSYLSVLSTTGRYLSTTFAMTLLLLPQYHPKVPVVQMVKEIHLHQVPWDIAHVRA